MKSLELKIIENNLQNFVDYNNEIGKKGTLVFK